MARSIVVVVILVSVTSIVSVRDVGTGGPSLTWMIREDVEVPLSFTAATATTYAIFRYAPVRLMDVEDVSEIIADSCGFSTIRHDVAY